MSCDGLWAGYSWRSFVGASAVVKCQAMVTASALREVAHTVTCAVRNQHDPPAIRQEAAVILASSHRTFPAIVLRAAVGLIVHVHRDLAMVIRMRATVVAVDPRRAPVERGGITVVAIDDRRTPILRKCC